MRIGHGYDVHRLAAGRRLVLGGVEIPFDKGLDGHSDADAAVHALMDALLGAAGLGDIGRLFPDNDDRTLGIDSLSLLDTVMGLIRSKGYALGNADLTIVAQAPKLSPYIDKMRQTLAAHLGAGPDRVNVKATTEERLGEVSTRGIAAHAVVLLEELPRAKNL